MTDYIVPLILLGTSLMALRRRENVRNFILLALGFCLDLLSTGHRLHALDLATARVDIADNVTEVIVGSRDRHLHDRLGQDGICLTHGFSFSI